MAQRLLGNAELDRIGLAMRARRGVPSAQTGHAAQTPELEIGPASDIAPRRQSV